MLVWEALFCSLTSARPSTPFDTSTPSDTSTPCDTSDEAGDFSWCFWNSFLLVHVLPGGHSDCEGGKCHLCPWAASLPSPSWLGAGFVALFGLHRSGSCYCRPAERYTSRVLAWYSASSVYRWHVRTSEIDCGAEERWTHLLLPAETADWFTENRVKLNIDEISWSATPST